MTRHRGPAWRRSLAARLRAPRIRVKILLDCDSDSAWRALHDPTVAAQLYAPILRMAPVRGALPEAFVSGTRLLVRIRLLGVVPLGRQLIVIEDATPGELGPAHRTMRDIGHPVSGPLALLRGWHHEMTVQSDAHGRTIWLDELTVAGGAALICAPVLWVTWRWRGRRLRSLARYWGDPAPEPQPRSTPRREHTTR
ncbi:hypothetical protein EDF60_2804 [Leucobacter luti]|uniref:hypothetical protein n=1 Tax=Leucobacter luti TaxID=340320 RepID=UPI00104E742C|nr:hypothetical protein [Leucobacter luti]MCW2289926.1 hypothetical protein [Leucobacter luti]TCK36095.1 hypothetical protein EDF60_2804 [Leucobacter luti]